MFLITYDISSPKRLQRIARLMEKYGGRAQKSVFECNLSNERLLQLQKKAKKIMNLEKDSVRFYYLCHNCLGKVESFGTGALPLEENFVVI